MHSDFLIALSRDALNGKLSHEAESRGNARELGKSLPASGNCFSPSLETAEEIISE